MKAVRHRNGPGTVNQDGPKVRPPPPTNSPRPAEQEASRGRKPPQYPRGGKSQNFRMTHLYYAEQRSTVGQHS